MHDSVTTKAIAIPGSKRGRYSAPEGPNSETPRHLADVVPFQAGAAVLEIRTQRVLGARKGDVGPRNLVRGDQLHFQAFVRRAEIRRAHPRAEEYVHLFGVPH